MAEAAGMAKVVEAMEKSKKALTQTLQDFKWILGATLYGSVARASNAEKAAAIYEDVMVWASSLSYAGLLKKVKSDLRDLVVSHLIHELCASGDLQNERYFDDKVSDLFPNMEDEHLLSQLKNCYHKQVRSAGLTGFRSANAVATSVRGRPRPRRRTARPRPRTAMPRMHISVRNTFVHVGETSSSPPRSSSCPGRLGYVVKETAMTSPNDAGIDEDRNGKKAAACHSIAYGSQPTAFACTSAPANNLGRADNGSMYDKAECFTVDDMEEDLKVGGAAVEQYQRAHELYVGTVGRSSPLFCSAAEGLAKALHAERRYEEAFEAVLEAYEVHAKGDAVHPTPLFENLDLALQIHGQCSTVELARFASLIDAGVANLDRRGLIEDGNSGCTMDEMLAALQNATIDGFKVGAGGQLENIDLVGVADGRDCYCTQFVRTFPSQWSDFPSQLS